MKNKLFFLLLALSCWGCEPDPEVKPNDPAVLEDIHLGSTKSFVPIDILKNASKVIFVNDLGDEKVLHLLVESGARTLTQDFQSYNAEFYLITYIDSLREIPYLPSIALQTQYGDQNRREEVLIVKLFSYDYAFPATIIINYDGELLIGTFINEFTVCNLTFNNVYSNSQNPNLEPHFSKIYYTMAQGIVGFEELNGEMWALDTIEN